MGKLGWIVELADHTSIVHLNDAVGKLINAAVVSDNDHATVGPDGAFLEKLQCFVSRSRIQCGRGLITDDEAGLVHQRARNGHALLLPSGELAGIGFVFIG